MVRRRMSGFSLMELLIAIVIISIISSVAIPSYLNYTRKAHYSEIVKSTAVYKISVVECFHEIGQLLGCNGGIHGIANDIVEAVGAIANLSVKDGVISVVPVEKNGIKTTDTYVLKPEIKNGMIVWQSSGGGVSQGYAK